MVESLVNDVLVWFYVLAPVAVLAGAMGAAAFLAQMISRSGAPAAKGGAKGGPAHAGGKPAAGGSGGHH
jgi:hypothetical protein